MLKDLIPQGEEVNLGGTKQKLRGLTMDDIVSLYTSHKDEVNAVLGGELSPEKVLETAPLLAYKAIAMGAGEPDNAEVAKQLPAGMQLTALDAIWRQTLVDPAEVEKLVRRLVSVVGKYAGDLIPQVNS